jgi:hypothetical protein
MLKAKPRQRAGRLAETARQSRPPSLASMQDELAKLELIRGIDLPADLFDRTSPRDLERCRQRVGRGSRDLRRHPDARASPGWPLSSTCAPAA